MELPPVSLPPGVAGAFPPLVTATVQSVLAQNRYLIQVQGLLLELETELFLGAGDKLPLRVASQTPQEVVFELARPPQSGEPEASPPPRVPPEAAELVRDFVRMRAPLDPNMISRVLPVARDGPARQAAAFLAGHGLEPSAERVAALARLAQAPTGGIPENAPPLLAALVQALEERVAETPSQAARTAPLLAGPPPTALEESVAKVLENSPRLQMFDRLIEALSQAPALEVPAAEVPSAELPARLQQALRLVQAATPENLAETLRSFPPLPREALRQVLQEAQALERKEFAATPELAQTRAAGQLILDAAGRMGDLRLVNQLSQLRDDGVLLLEIPVRTDGRVELLPLRVRREADPPGTADPGSAFSVTLDADLSRLGLVRARLDMSGRSLRVRLRTRERGVRAHLEKGVEALVEALKAQGYEASVAAELVATLERESIFDVFASPDESITLDVRL